MKTKKILLVALMVIMALALVTGCKKGKVKVEPYTVDLSTLSMTINPEPLSKQWDDVAIYFGENSFPKDMDWLKFNRVRIQAKYYWDDMEEHFPENGMVMVSFVYDPEGDWRGPEMGPGPNTPLKAFNVGTDGPGDVSMEKGAPIALTQAPSIILFQNGNESVSFIEVTEITFFRAEGEGSF